jgi:TonB family protein
MSADKHHSDQLQRYLAGQMSDKERHDFERKALDDPFLQDALEGAESMPAADFTADVHQLDKRITTKKSGIAFWQIAAVIALLMVSGISIWLIRDTTEPAELVHKDTTDTEESDPAPAPEDSIAVFEEKQVAENRSAKPAEEPKPVAAAEVVQPKEQVIVTTFDAVSSAEGVRAEPLEMSDVVANDLEESETRAWQETAAESKAEGAAPVRQKTMAYTDAAKKETSVRRSASTSTRTVTGLVMDDFGEPLPGVNVVIKGTTTGATTDLDGQFALEVNDEQSLVFSSVGMQSQEATVGARSTMEVYLSTDNKALQEVVVVGYGTTGNDPDGYKEAYPTMGFTEFKQYMEEEMVYPEQAISQGIEGRVVLQLTISPTGNVSNIEVKRSLGFGCDEEAVRLIKEGPRWSPATRDGVNVESKVRVRVKFEL